MKTWTIAKWSLGLAVAVLPVVGGCARESTVSSVEKVSTPETNSATTAISTPEEAEPDLANAAATMVAPPQAAVQAAQLAPAAAEVARLAQSGLDENVMLTFINTSSNAFNLGAEQIIYLNDIGVPANVVTAMIQRDQAVKAATLVPVAPAAVVNHQPAPVQEAAVETATEQPPQVMLETTPAPTANVTTAYFYDALAPYGSWLEVEGYGRCWQPSVVVADRSWSPYCNRGHWVYSDCGWYWASDYSWGWAPFHYGRWFRHNYWGWCWAPDTVWGPSWVSWRYNSGYCGWAPLPPAACYRAGVGFSYHGAAVGVSFGFGLGADCFTFVAANRFCDPHPYHHRVPPHEATQIFKQTTIINPVVEARGDSRMHRGIPARHIAEATHTEIKPVKIHETTGTLWNHRGEQQDRGQGTLTVFRPHLSDAPAAPGGGRAGEGSRPTPSENVDRGFDSGRTMHRGVPVKSSGLAGTRPETVLSGTSEAPASRTPGAGRGIPAAGSASYRMTPAVRETPAEVKSAMPATSPGGRSHSGNVTSFKPNASPVTGNPATAPIRNSLLLNRASPTRPTTTAGESSAAVQNPVVRQEQSAARQEPSHSQPPVGRTFTAAPATPARSVETRTYQAYVPPTPAPVPPAAFNPPMERVAPVRPSIVPTPRVESVPAPATVRPAQQPQTGGSASPDKTHDRPGGRNPR